MAPLLPPTLTEYNMILNRANILKAIPDDNELCARIILDSSTTDDFKKLTYVLVREYKAVDGACRQLNIGKHTMEKAKDEKIADLEKVIKDKESHIGDLSRNILGLTSRKG
ncbi:hypothetical protein FKW77_000928 [Venturia effusa]|uniref:Uncharacterized protein n=1 Tax=Venturia effusa TaxID=50376 RepID=A0A517LGG7_9PEZI|nr:hypothetical protein FKW77_000928 [Venturia effusa]